MSIHDATTLGLALRAARALDRALAKLDEQAREHKGPLSNLHDTDTYIGYINAHLAEAIEWLEEEQRKAKRAEEGGQ